LTPAGCVSYEIVISTILAVNFQKLPQKLIHLKVIETNHFAPMGTFHPESLNL